MSKKKKLERIIKLQIEAGKANPAPPVGTALGPAGVNIMGFCKEFNAATQKMAGEILPTEISVYADKSFTFITKQPPVSSLIKKELSLKSGSKMPNKEKVGVLTHKQIESIVEKKYPDLRVSGKEAAAQCVIGSARSMGIDVENGG